VKASRAYIAGLGTSGVLIASFLLLLMVGSAFVAFEGAPGQASNDGLGRLDVSPGTHSSNATRAERPDGGLTGSHRAERDRGDRHRARRAGGSSRGRLGRRSADGAGGVDGERRAGGLTAGVVDSGRQGDSAAGTGDSASSGGRSTGVGAGSHAKPGPPLGTSPSVPPLGDVAGGLADTVEQTTGDLGGTVEEVAPPAEAPVVGTGEALDEAVGPTVPPPDDPVTGVTDTVGGVTDSTGGAVGGAP
jgi:hypothetical protein